MGTQIVYAILLSFGASALCCIIFAICLAYLSKDEDKK